MNNTLEDRVVIDMSQYLGDDEDFLVYHSEVNIKDKKQFSKDYSKAYMAWVSPKRNTGELVQK